MTLFPSTNHHFQYIGHTDGGPPTVGSFVQGNWCRDNDEIWLCVAPGTPGNWQSMNVAGTSMQFVSGLDLTGATDNTAIIQAAIDAAFTAGGGRILMPSHGTVQAVGVQLKTNVRLEGNCTLKLPASAANHLLLADYADNVSIGDGICLDGNGANQGGAVRHAFAPWTATNLRIGDILVKNTTGDAILLLGCTDVTIGNIVGTGIGRNGLGASVGAASAATDRVVFGNCTFDAATTFGSPNGGIDLEPAKNVSGGVIVVRGFAYNAIIKGTAAGSCNNIAIASFVGSGATAAHYGIFVDASAGAVDQVKIAAYVLNNPLAAGDIGFAGTPTNVQIGPGPFGFPRPYPFPGTNANVSVRAANYTHYYRVVEGGSISKVRVNIAVNSGQACVAAYRNSGRGLAAVPGTRLATSGAITPAGTGIRDLALGSTVFLEAGDWIAISADNVTMTFLGATGTGGNAIFGSIMSSEAVFPAPTTPSPNTGDTLAQIYFVGVP